MDAAGALHLTKHHGAGNDFLVLLDPDDRRPLSAVEARALCDRHRGIGADGVVRAVVGGKAADLSMDLRNADGGVAEMSGNGIRCLVQAAVDAGMVGAGIVTVQTRGGVRTVEYRAEAAPGLGYGHVDMGPATLGVDLDAEAPVGVRWGQHVDMGNPHVVLFGPQFGDDFGDDMVRVVGPRLTSSVAGGANVEFVWPGPANGELTLRVWERGVGETLACGTGACAAAAAAHAHGEVGTRVRVHNPGGPLDVELGADGITLAGPTQKVADVTMEEEVLAALTRALEGGDSPTADHDADDGRATTRARPHSDGAASDDLSTEVATRR
jgi:diaminopimelate epimerase